MRLTIGLLLSTIIAILPLASAHAGAWTQEKGRGLFIASGSYYTSDERIDNSGNKQSQPTYSQYLLNPYLEYGLYDGITAGANLMLQRTQQSGRHNYGIGDSEFFLRARLWRQDGFVISAEPMLKLPSPDSNRDTPKIGGDDPDAGLGLSAGYGFPAWGQHHFVNFDAQYRHRFGTPNDQVNIAATAGFGISPTLMLLPQAFITLRTDTPAVATFTQSSGDDYNLYKLQLTAVYKITADTSVQFGGFSHVDGKNTGLGHGVLLALWKSF